MEFEWDESKNAQNIRKHGVSFDVAKDAFDDENQIERSDDLVFYGEERFILIGLAKDELLYVVFTERGNRTRIISARRATKHEQQDYYQQTRS